MSATITGLVAEVLAVLDRERGDADVDAVLARFGARGEHVEVQRGGTLLETDHYVTAVASYADGRLTQVTIRTQPETHGPAYGAPEELIEGLPLDGTLDDVITFLGEPDAMGSRGDAARFAANDRFVNIWFAPSGKLGRITALLRAG